MANAISSEIRQANEPRAIIKAAKAVESSFIKEMLTATDLGKMGKDNQDEFRSFLLGAYAARLVEPGGFGLADAIAHSLRAQIK